MSFLKHLLSPWPASYCGQNIKYHKYKYNQSDILSATFPGKTIPLPRGHAHLAVFMDDKDYNFTHRINKLSFGDPAPGIVHPLEGDEEVADKSKDSLGHVIPKDSHLAFM